MEKQLTIGKLIEVLDKNRKKYGDDIPIYHVEFGGLVESYHVFCDEIMNYTDDEKMKIVYICKR